MSLPVFHSPQAAEAVAGSALTLGEDVAGHAVRVRRIGPGEEIDVVDGHGVRARGTVSTASATALVLDVTEVTRTPAHGPRPGPVQARAKGDRDRQAIEAATEIGVDEVIPWAAERSIADWPAKKAAKMAAKWENLLTAASLQSRRSRFPVLGELARGTGLAHRLGEGTGDSAAADPGGEAIFVLHEAAATRLTAQLRDLDAGSTERIVLIVGPEGGITEAELEALQGIGARTVVLGDTVLRSSSAGPAGLVLAQNSLGRW